MNIDYKKLFCQEKARRKQLEETIKILKGLISEIITSSKQSKKSKKSKQSKQSKQSIVVSSDSSSCTDSSDDEKQTHLTSPSPLPPQILFS